MVGFELDEDDRITRCGIGLLGLGSTRCGPARPRRPSISTPIGGITADEIGRLAMSELTDIPSDLQGSASYRSRVGAAMVSRAWTQAITHSEETLNA